LRKQILSFDFPILRCTADFDPYGRVPPAWLGEDRYDYAFTDRLLEGQDVGVVLDIVTCSPPWWDALHGEELVVWEDGSTRHPLKCGKDQVPSLGSAPWRKAMKTNIERLVRHVEASSRADRVAGYAVSFGASDNWTHFGTEEGFLFDYHPGWDPVPAPADRAFVDPRGFREPERHRSIIDHGRRLARTTAEAIMDAAGAVKAASPRPFGVRYGDFFRPLAWQNGLQHSGQLGLHHLLDCPDIDFLLDAVPEASARLHGKSKGSKEARIACVLDDDSMYYVQRPKEQLEELIAGQCRELKDFDIVLFRDLEEAPPYRFLIFPNLFFADQSVREFVHRILKRNQATALWLVAPGFVDREARFENMEKLTGIRAVKPDKPHRSVIEAEGMKYGNPGMFAHTPVIADEACRILGTYEDSGLPGLGEKRMDGWRSLYSGAPVVCAGLIERFVEEAFS
jgi:hypothetical protein